MNLQDLLELVKQEDHTFYLSIIQEANENSSESHKVGKKLRGLDSATVAKLTDNQLLLLKSLRFKQGYHLTFGWAHNSTSIYSRVAKINTAVTHSFDTVVKENLKFLTTYEITQWRRVNGIASTRKVRGTGFVFKMDEFSLKLFKRSITKPFLRTEAKILVQAVNKAYDGGTPKDDTRVSIRNRFYGLILDNTPVQSNVLLNELYKTSISPSGTPGSYRDIQEGEAISVNMYRLAPAYATYHIMDTYSSDLAVVTHNAEVTDERVANRHIGAVSVLLTGYLKTANEQYKILATRLVASVSVELKEEAILKLESNQLLLTTLKGI